MMTTTTAVEIGDGDGEGPDVATTTGRRRRGFRFSDRIVGTLDPCVVETKAWMREYAHLWEQDDDDDGGIVSLAQGVVYWKPPPACREALLEVVSSMDDDGDDDPLALHSYSPEVGLPELVSALEEKIAVEHGMRHHDVTVTVGANQAYANVVLTLLGGGSGDDDSNDDDSNSNNNNSNNKAIVFAPYYFNHVMAIQMCAGPDAVVVGPTDMNTGVPDVEWLTKTLAESSFPGGGNSVRMVTLVNPGNPTGVALTKDTVGEIVSICRDHGVWVIIDCTYEHFFNTGGGGGGGGDDDDDDDTDDAASAASAPNPLPTFADDPHVIHVFSFSKGYAMAGYRCGYLVSHKTDPASGSSSADGGFFSQMLKVQDTVPIGPPRICQHVALGALRQGRGSGGNASSSSSSSDAATTGYAPSSREWVYRKYATLDTSRTCILEALSDLPRRIGGSGSMYVMGQLPDHLEIPPEDENENDEDDVVPADVRFCKRLVRDHGIAVIPGSFCGFPGWIRVCYANLPPERTEMAAERLRKGIAALTTAVTTTTTTRS